MLVYISSVFADYNPLFSSSTTPGFLTFFPLPSPATSFDTMSNPTEDGKTTFESSDSEEEVRRPDPDEELVITSLASGIIMVKVCTNRSLKRSVASN